MTTRPIVKTPDKSQAHPRRNRKSERGVVLLLVILCLGIMIALMGLALEVGAMYVTKQKAQTAADAAAQAGVMDLYNGGVSGFGSGSITCATSGGSAPCRYAQLNGFPANGSDTVTIDFSPSTPSVSSCAAPGVTLSSSDPVNLICVTVSRVMTTSLLGVLGVSTARTVTARSVAAVTTSVSTIPIVTVHPTLSGAFSTNGGPSVTVCGGPSRAIQINSASSTAITISGGGTVDLSKAGVADPNGDCSTGTGANLGNAGTQASYPGTLLLGTTGSYIQPSSAIRDPLSIISAPSQPGTNGSSVTYSSSAQYLAHSCPAACKVYSPGFYSNGISVGNSELAVFRPGIYWMNGNGFSVSGIARMAQAAMDMSDPATGTGWTSGMLIYNSPATPVKNSDVLNIGGGKIGPNTYPTTDCPNGGNCLIGSPTSSAYKGIFFFQNRATATSLTHTASGGQGGLDLTGTLYTSHTSASILSDGTYQKLAISGGNGVTTTLKSGIIADAFSISGGAALKIQLPAALTTVRQVALAQ